MIEWLRRAGAQWLFAPRGRVDRRLLPTEAPIIDKAISTLHTTMLPEVNTPMAEDCLMFTSFHSNVSVFCVSLDVSACAQA